MTQQAGRSIPRLTLVTGATGFVGTAVARRLHAEGFELRLMHRASANTANLQEIDAERCVGDLRDPASLSSAAAGCDAVFHVAADYRLWAPDPEALYATNVDGTLNLMRAAHGAGVERFVYTSSVAVLHAGKDGRAADEDTPVGIGDMVGHYKRSKFIAEARARALAAELDLDWVAVNPSTPIGPRDVRPTPTGKVVVDAASGRLPAYVDTGLNVAHVDDVAHGHLLAWRHGVSGRRYILGGDDLPLAAILGRAAVRAGHRAPRVRLPHAIVWPIALAAEGWARLTGSTAEPLATLDGVRMATKRMYFSSRRAETELGYRHRPGVEAIDDAVDWFATNGYLG